MTQSPMRHLGLPAWQRGHESNINAATKRWWPNSVSKSPSEHYTTCSLTYSRFHLYLQDCCPPQPLVQVAHAHPTFCPLQACVMECFATMQICSVKLLTVPVLRVVPGCPFRQKSTRVPPPADQPWPCQSAPTLFGRKSQKSLRSAALVPKMPGL